MSTYPSTKRSGNSDIMNDRIHNFSAGPAVLPEPVLQQAQEDIWNIDGTGIGVLEHSHRGPTIDRVFEEAESWTPRRAHAPYRKRGLEHALLSNTSSADDVNKNVLPARV